MGAAACHIRSSTKRWTTWERATACAFLPTCGPSSGSSAVSRFSSSSRGSACASGTPFRTSTPPTSRRTSPLLISAVSTTQSTASFAFNCDSSASSPRVSGKPEQVGKHVCVTGVLILSASLTAPGLMATAPAPAAQSSQDHADVERRLRTFERAIAAEPEDLKLGADYRQLTLNAGLFDRASDFF